MLEKVRLDKYLHAVRVFKTRSISSDYCQKEKVLINNLPAKPSRLIGIGEVIEIKFPPIIRTFIVTGLIEKRVSAKIAQEHIKETTPPEEFHKLKTIRESLPIREKGTGRPTKKERRTIDKYNDKTDIY